jgi:Tol biopolymer transport system component
MPFYTRIALCSLLIALVTGVVIWRGPQVQGVVLVAQTPLGAEASPGSVIRLTFSRPVDRRSVEERFALAPAVEGRFFWQDQTLTFRPSRPLAPNTAYRVNVATGIRDSQGRINQADLGWEFTTRGPRLLALTGTPGGSAALWRMEADGSNPRQLYETSESITSVAVSPDGTLAAVVETRGPFRSALLLLNLEDGSKRPLVDDETVSASGPAWSPAGDLVAYERRAVLEGSLGQPRIWLAQPGGTSLGPLYSGDDVNLAPVWSPDGSRMAFLDAVEMTIGVYDSHSDSVQKLSEVSSEAVSWMPDGTALVFASVNPTDNGVQFRLRRVELSSGATSDLTDGMLAAGTPAVSPDGNTIALALRAPDGPGSSLWLMGADGSNLRPLTQPGEYQDTLPVWSADGRRLAFIRNSIGGALESGAWEVALSGGEPRRLQQDAMQVLWLP